MRKSEGHVNITLLNSVKFYLMKLDYRWDVQALTHHQEPCWVGCWREERDAEIRGSVFKLKHPARLCLSVWTRRPTELFCVNVLWPVAAVYLVLDCRLYAGQLMTFAVVRWSCWHIWEPGAGVCSPATRLEVRYRRSKTRVTTWI